MSEKTFPVRVVRVDYEAVDVVSIHLQGVDGAGLPAYTPGAHIDLHLPGGVERSYSLSRAFQPGQPYRLTIAKDAASRGGSSYIHDQLRVGQVIEISAPLNNFELAVDADTSVFIAGGIGVTPFVPMIEQLNSVNRSWRLHYCLRTRDRAALLAELERLCERAGGELLLNIDGEAGGELLDIPKVLARLPHGAHAYCCGPTGMLDAFRTAARDLALDETRIHFEYFASETIAATEGGFRIKLARTGKTLEVLAGQTILDVVQACGVDVPFSCQEGICGSCETRILSGVADHRDMILSDRERAEGKIMMICCSGSKSPELVLDL
jgi:tetrachlorobenzoquinone reductase